MGVAKPRALDLFCKAGGATKGLQRAGFHVTGVDIEPQPHYCGDEFIQADALAFPLEGYGFIWASPPCQAYCALRHLYPSRTYPDLIAATRSRLLVTAAGLWVIENVPKSPLLKPVQLCGSAFGLMVRRHRHFESNCRLAGSLCFHNLQGRPIDVSGTGGRRINRRPDDHGGNTNKPRTLQEARKAIGIDWMNRAELSQAIPPAYSEYIGKIVMQTIIGKRASQ